ncbi:sortase domain-containing protein [Streptomyces sp. H39-S7]|uniref:sortase domain-containing protein n=1 Tax=Streptomyces sp. H39-S7 TaxID=3004357 RepID=UPI0022AFD439|nr:sortase [Streptomyces sp. H39-S7]MCZ4125573.1 sortase [Streptomyces sp. H39-S7]
MTPHRRMTEGRRSIVTAAAGVCVLAGTVALSAGIAGNWNVAPPAKPVPAGTVPPTAQRPVSSPIPAGLPRSQPTAVDIPQVGLHANLQAVTLSPDGEVPLPEDPVYAAWLASSPTPGERGASIVAGHVDTDHGPAAFYQLSAVHPGMAVAVKRRDGTTAHFTIDAVAVYPQNAFPAATVYAPAPGPALRLITCTGWDPDTRAYQDNVVVYATTHPRPVPDA